MLGILIPALALYPMHRNEETFMLDIKYRYAIVIATILASWGALQYITMRGLNVFTDPVVGACALLNTVYSFAGLWYLMQGDMQQTKVWMGLMIAGLILAAGEVFALGRNDLLRPALVGNVAPALFERKTTPSISLRPSSRLGAPATM
jgi:hypothetical protein